MFGLGIYTASAIIFIIILALLLLKDRKNVERENAVFFLRRTQRGKRFLYRLGSSHPRFWRMTGNLAVVVGFAVSVWFTWMMLAQLPMIASGAIPKEASGGILLPSLTDEATLGRGFILVPFWYWIIALSVILLAHEGMHAMLGITARIRIKSIGWGLLAILPLGFVEPDEKQAEKKKAAEQLRFFAAGSFGNFLVAAASLLILIFIFNPAFTSNGVFYRAVAEGYPAHAANMTGYIIAIDSYGINSTADLARVSEMIGPNRTVVVTTVNASERGLEELRFVLETAPEPEPVFKPDAFTGLFAAVESIAPGTIDFLDKPPWGMGRAGWSDTAYGISKWSYLADGYPALRERALDRVQALRSELITKPRRGHLGIAFAGDVRGLKPGLGGYAEAIEFFGGLFFWLFLLNFGVGAFNLLPMKPLDGERMWRLAVQRLGRTTAKRASKVMNYVSIAVFFLIIAFFALVVA